MFRTFIYNGSPAHLLCGINDYFTNIEKIEKKLEECEKTKIKTLWRPMCFSIDYVETAQCCMDCEFYVACGKIKEFKKTLRKFPEEDEENN